MGSSKEDSNTAFFYSDPQINQVSNLDWLWQIFKHRDASIRIMGYQMASIIGLDFVVYFSLNPLTFSLTRETDTKMPRDKR